MKATSKFAEAGRLQIDDADMIIVIDGRSVCDDTTVLKTADNSSQLSSAQLSRSCLVMTTESSINNQPTSKFNPDPNPNPTTKQHATVSIQLYIVTCASEIHTRQCLLHHFCYFLNSRYSSVHYSTDLSSSSSWKRSIANDRRIVCQLNTPV